MNNYSEFTHLYPVQKTLRFELKPQGRTKEHLVSSNFFEEDRERAKKYKILKIVIDNYHKKFIDECLSTLSLDWNLLKEAMEKYHGSRDEKDRKILESEQKRMRGMIVSAFKNDERFKLLFSEKLFSVLLKEDVYRRGNSQEIDALESFNRFSGYFIGFHENRANMYSDGNENTAVANRLVNENFPKFLGNLQKYMNARRQYPEYIRDAESALAAYDIRMDEIFSINSFNDVLRQEGIDRYNLAVGGYAPNIGEKVQGINEFLNLAYQNNPSIKRIRMEPLYKQILSDRESFSHVLEAFSEDSQLLTAINNFFVGIETDREGNTFDRAVGLISSHLDYDISKIYIRQTDLSKISMEIFNNWETLGGMLRDFKAKSLGDSKIEKTGKKVDEWLNSKEFTLSDILSAMSDSGTEKTFEAYVSKVSEARKKIDCAKFGITGITEKISGNEKSIGIIKAAMDSVQRLLHLIRPFQARLELPQDGAFYTEFNEVYDKISEVIPLYNRTRNYLTKNNLNMSKIKLNFKNPTLANGWDLNKEYDNTAVILIRDGNYYLGIMDPSRKKNIKFDVRAGTGPFYQKMEYKLLPGPNKMLPKVFFSAKNKDFYNPSKEILSGYETDKHKKGDNFDIEFCHKLIDFFKGSIQKNKDWRVFDFKFSPTESYNDISEFYKEVEKQGYKMSFVNIPAESIDGYVEAGDLFLFQIYNKDFAKGAKGNKDMHTIYWNAAFSEENLHNVIVKLNGEAELFYRDKSDINKVVHKKGDMLVNRTCYDKTPVPDKIHRELFEYYNKRLREEQLTEDARKYIDKVRVFEANYDIAKDRRYLEDKIYFHVPLTLNFAADEKEDLNKKVIKKFLSDKDAHIIGIDRGERNLLYVSVIDRNGSIIVQKDFNIIDKFDYHAKLDQREKERKDARETWTSIGKIKDLKEGYLSKVIHEVSKMAVEYNAIVVLEDLNFGFKRGRFKVEKQVYQKFEKMLIDKLNYLVFKGLSGSSAGGVLNAYQLTNPLESFNKLGKQSGILFYIPAAYTSKIDPTTGFVNLFNTASITSIPARKEFLQRFESITYSAKDGGIFAFKFDYRKFSTSKADHRNIWTVYTNGERLKYNRSRNSYETTDPTKRIKDVLSSSGIKYDGGSNIRDDIVQSDNNNVINTVYYSLMDALQMRNSDAERDYIISPIKNRKGEFFRTDPESTSLPKDADANGVYHIALKGELLMRMMKEKFDPDVDRVTIPRMEHKDWFEFMQTRGD